MDNQCEPLGGVITTTATTLSPQNTTAPFFQIDCVTQDECPLVTAGCVTLLVINIVILITCFKIKCGGERVARCFGILLRVIVIATVLVQDMIAFRLTPWTTKVFFVFWGFGLIVSIIDIMSAGGCPDILATIFVCIVEIVQALLLMWVIKDDPNGNGLYYDDAEEDKVFKYGSVMIFSTFCVVQVICEMIKYKVDRDSNYPEDEDAMRKDCASGWIEVVFSILYGALLLPIAMFPYGSPWKTNSFGYFSTFVLWLTLLWRECIFTFNGVGNGRDSFLFGATMFSLGSWGIFIYMFIFGIRNLDEVNDYVDDMEAEQESGEENADCWLREAEFQKSGTIYLIALTAVALVGSCVWCMISWKNRTLRGRYSSMTPV